MQIYHQPHNSVGNHSYNLYFYDDIEYSPHFHRNYEIIFVLEGEMLCTVNGMAQLMKKGDFAVCLSNQVHSMHTEMHSRVWIGVFSEDFIYEFKKHMQGRHGEGFCFCCAPNITEYLCQNLIKAELSDVFMIKSCLYALCSEYLRQIPTVCGSDRQQVLMGDIVEYIEENYKKNISLRSLAESLGYEYCYFSRFFNKIFAMSFSDYLATYRFNQACAMLTETDASITQVAYESGFQSIRSFNHIFKKLSGMSPYEYRGNK